MNISRKNAALILGEMSSIIGHAMNIMDRSGVILASTDPQRIGTFHEGAAAIMENSLEELTIKDFYQYSGAREGINLPLMVNGEIVGVVGITGDPQEVGMYGRIIKRMTEILLADSYLNDKNKREQAMRERYIEEWIYDRNACKTGAFVARGVQLGINVSVPRTIIIAAFKIQESFENILQAEYELYAFEKYIQDCLRDNKENIYIKTGARYVIMLCGKTRGQIEALADKLRQKSKSLMLPPLAAGCDCKEFSGGSLRDAFEHAEKALKISTGSSGALRFYEDITTELLFNEIPLKTREEFIGKIFKGCAQNEIEDWISFVQVFLECDGSIGETAGRLFIHKNTVQYRLKKLAEITGYDARNIKHAAVYYIAIELLSLNSDKR